mgnify:CR=1 FL=1
MAKKEKLTTMKQESIKKGLTKPMSSKRPKSWKGGAVAKTQTKGAKSSDPFMSESVQRQLALADKAKKLDRALGNSGSSFNNSVVRLKKAVQGQRGK